MGKFFRWKSLPSSARNRIKVICTNYLDGEDGDLTTHNVNEQLIDDFLFGLKEDLRQSVADILPKPVSSDLKKF